MVLLLMGKKGIFSREGVITAQNGPQKPGLKVGQEAKGERRETTSLTHLL
jgi:hypothetical protein